MSVYNFSYTSIEGKEVSLEEYNGKVLLIVNTASKCGLTPQYEGLEALYQKYKNEGLVVIGFPCDQFMGQEPGTDGEIAEFCKVRFGVSFPLSQKVKVIGADAIPLYKHLTKEKPFTGKLGMMLKLAAKSNAKQQGAFENDVKWNFGKFLIGRDGTVLARFEPDVKPEELAGFIEEALK